MFFLDTAIPEIQTLHQAIKQATVGREKLDLMKQIVALRSKKPSDTAFANTIEKQAAIGYLNYAKNQPPKTLNSDKVIANLKAVNQTLDIMESGFDEMGRPIFSVSAVIGGDVFSGKMTFGRLIPIILTNKTEEQINEDNAIKKKSTATISTPRSYKPQKNNTTTEKENKEREHIIAAKELLLLHSNTYAGFTVGDYNALRSNKKIHQDAFTRNELRFLEQISVYDKPLTEKQQSWLVSIANKRRVSYAAAEKASKRKLASEKNQYPRGGSYEDADMPEYDPISKTWHDLETGLEISPPKRGFLDNATQTDNTMLTQTFRNFEYATFDRAEISEIETLRAGIKASTTGREKLDLMKQIVALRQPPTQPTDTQDPTLETFTAEDLIPDGDNNMVKTAKGTKVSTGFAVVEASRLIVSHDNQGNENQEYPYELQPRDRKRAESVAWVLKTAKNLDVDSLGKTRRADSGAPIVGKDRVVESGNGRTMAIIEAYRIGEADEYRDWLIDEAQSFGLNPDKIKAMKKPVLVRVRKSKLDRVAFATEANQDDKLAMTATEKAKADANRLTPDLIAKLKDGDLTSASNRDFILGFLQSLGDTEAAQYSTTDGKPTKQIFDRVQAALFAHAYNNDRLLQLMADDAKPEIKNILNALNAASPTFIKAKSINEDAHSKTTAQLTDSIETSLDQEAVNTIISATNVIMDAKNKGLSIDELLSQEDMFGSNITPEIAAMALFIKDNNKSSTRLAMAFQEMASFIKSDLQSRQTNSLFGDDEPVSLVDVLKVANDKLKQIYGDNVKTIGGGNLGGFIDLFTETWGQKADREAFLAGQEPSVDSNVALLQDIAQGQYSHLNSEALLDMIEPAARAVDVASYATLINEAEDEWLKVDNRDYALDSVYREAS